MLGRDYRIYPLGDAALEVCFGNRIDNGIHQRVISLWHSLQSDPLPGQTDLTPAYCTLALHVDRRLIDLEEFHSLFALLIKRVESLAIRSTPEATVLHVPVCYEGSCAPDMQLLADRLQLTEASIIEFHARSIYSVYLLGFLPGFPYMGILPPALQLPRKERPELVSAGTVAIAADQTGIYPSDSPGGWWCIGKTPLRVFAPDDPRIALFAPGDRIQFYPIPHNDFLLIERTARDIPFTSLREKGGWT